MYWVVQLLREAGSKDFIITSIAAFSALCLVVGLGRGWHFCATATCSFGEICTPASCPLLAVSPLLVCFRGVVQTCSRSPALPCLFATGLALVADLLHTNSTGFGRSYVTQPLAGM